MSAVKTWFVTGCNRGIGLEFVKQLVASKNRVLATCREPTSAGASELAKIAIENSDLLTVLPMDVTDEASIDAAAQHLQSAGLQIDVLVNNAGVAPPGHPAPDAALDFRKEKMEFTFGVNVIGPLNVTKHLQALLAPESKVVIISSILGSIETVGGDMRVVSYAVSKAAVNMAGKCLSAELKPRGTSLLLLHPGWVDTDMGSAGGRKAPVTPSASVAGMVEVINGHTLEQTGRFTDYQGTDLPF